MRTHPRHQRYSAMATVGLLAILGIPGLDDLGYLLGLTPEKKESYSAADFRAMGRTHAPDRTLRSGCRNYSYTYAIDPPRGHKWSLEIEITDPDGTGVAADLFASGSAPAKDRQTFRLCRSTTEFGRFTIRGKLTLQDYPDKQSGAIKKSTFRMSRP